MAVSLLQAAALAPLVPLADALSLAHARPRQNTGGFEYGRVRGVGSAAFVAGTLLAGQAVGGYGLSAIMWLSATALLTIPIAAPFADAGRHQPRNRRRAVGGVGRRRGTRLSILGSKTVASGYTYCRIGGGGIFRADALGSHGADGRRCGAWPCPALARIHLCAPPPRIHAHHYRHGAASFGRNRAGGLWSRWSRRCYRRFDAAVRMALCAFRTGRFLGDGSTLCCRIPRHLAAASGLPAPVPLLRNFSNGWTGRQWLEATGERYA